LRKLHLVGLTTDRDGLIFTARKGSKSGGFIVPLDDKLLTAIVQAGEGPNGEQRGPAATTGDIEAVPKRLRSESALTPREMQARLRSGRSIEEVAAEAGVDTEWVARFAVPILAEQAQVVELARALVYAKPRLGDSTQTLGVSVLQNLSDRGVFLPDDVANAGWSAFQLHDAIWMVRFRYRARGKDQEAQWEIDVSAGRLRARNRHASDLGYIGPDRWATDPDDLPNGDEPATATASPRRSRPAPARPEPMASAVARAKRTTAERPRPSSAVATSRGTGRRGAASKVPVAKAMPKVTTAANGARSTGATRAPRASGGGRAGGVVGAKKAPAARAARTASTAKTPATGRQRTAGTAKAPAGGATRAAPAVKRRAAKATPPDPAPTAGSGGVRMAVARVSTARVAASMAAADRAPWAAAVRRPARASDGNGTPPVDLRRQASRPIVAEPVVRTRRSPEQPQVRSFQPRPLPPPGQEPQPPRVRKVTVPAPRRLGASPSSGDGPAVSLPAPRTPAPRAEPLPAERSKRRRLRPR
jgi:hypothetical protein